MTISYLFGDANGYGNTVHATVTATEVPAAPDFWAVLVGRALRETVQTGRSDVTGAHDAVSSGRL
jgi:hypothetical protein